MKTEKLNDLLELNNNNYDEIKDVLLNRFDVLGDIVYVDFNELLNFKNIERLSIVNFSLGDDFIYILYKLSNLKYLRLINCDINFDMDLLNNLNASELVFDNTSIDLNALDKKYLSIEIRNMNIDCSGIKTDTLIISSSNVDISTINFDNINTLVISNTQFKNCGVFTDNYPVNLIIKDDDSDEVINTYGKN